MARDLTDRILIVTGSSSGIGRATALEAAKAGMHVVLTARREDRLRDVAKAIEALGRKALCVAGDAADAGFSARLLDETERTFGRFDVVFSNAGYGLERRAVEIGNDEMRRLFEVNYFASVDLVRLAAERLVARKQRGHLLMCSSCVARFSLPGYGVYAASKAAQALYCQGLRHELRPFGIDVSSVHPVTTATEFFDVASTVGKAAPGEPTGKVADHAPKMFVQPPERVARAVIRCLRRPCPEVWTSFSARFAAGLFTVFPRVGDLFLRPYLRYLPPAEAPPRR
ncbi:MAG: SDR family NAD(P)-dependent oxidoreductase [Phycisphaerae bacterium]|nr:SDR family NAD(P)-dependent oxidoreductase [Phycisphaerae bacterium]